ncbi:hypothetical protein OG21DRAFT_1521047 [Imleria badia]|nr:hypothetical protein OG21DRAFT_1521047 [Imleria badia]
MPFDHSGHWFPPTTVHPSELHAPLPSGCSYESLVPPYTGQTPGELLERYYSGRGTFDWTDPMVVLKNQLEVLQNCAGAALGAPGLVGKRERPNGLSAEPVPAYGADSVLDNPRVVVEFRNRDQGGPSKDTDPAKLQGAEDIVLDGLRGSDLEFIIAWPGYEPERFTIHIALTNGRPFTRFHLGEQITIAYAIFFRKVEKERLLPNAPGFYNIALHQGRNGRSDSLGVQFMQLRLVRFRNTIGGSWVADVEIVACVTYAPPVVQTSSLPWGARARPSAKLGPSDIMHHVLCAAGSEAIPDDRRDSLGRTPSPGPEDKVMVESIRERIWRHAAIPSDIFLKGTTWLATAAESLVILGSLRHTPRSPDTISDFLHALGPVQSSKLTVPFVLGASLIIAGGLIRVKASRSLGPFFTFEQCLRKEHRLITSGPYAMVRHPGYGGLLMCLVGWCIVHGSPGSWLRASGVLGAGWVRVGVGCWCFLTAACIATVFRRSADEDQFLSHRFGREWESWARRVKYRLVPFLY